MNNTFQPAFENGKICYLEIPALDIGQSARFYQRVFSWHIREDATGAISFDDTVGQVSGMWVLDREPTSKPGIIISIMMDSIAHTLELIIENKGQVIERPTENAQEAVALFADPAGNVFCLYQHQPSRIG